MTWPIHVCITNIKMTHMTLLYTLKKKTNMTLSYTSSTTRDSFICDMTHSHETWLFHMCGAIICDMTHSFMTRLIYTRCDSFTRDVTYSCVTWLIHVWHASFTWDTTPSYVWCDHMWHDWHDSNIHALNNINIIHVEPIAFGVSLNLNLQSQSPWSLFNRKW